MRRRCRFAQFTLVYFLAINHHLFWRSDTEADWVAFDAEDGFYDIGANVQGFGRAEGPGERGGVVAECAGYLCGDTRAQSAGERERERPQKASGMTHYFGWCYK